MGKYELKTKENKKSVFEFIKSVGDKQKIADAKVLMKLMKDASGKNGKMWGSSIIGFGKIHYKYKSGQEGDWPPIGFSPRKQGHSLYILSGFKGKEAMLKNLGKYKTGVSCLYINKLEDVDMKVLKKMIKESYKYSVKNNTVC